MKGVNWRLTNSLHFWHAQSCEGTVYTGSLPPSIAVRQTNLHCEIDFRDDERARKTKEIERQLADQQGELKALNKVKRKNR